MQTFILVALACASSLVVLIAPNIIAVGAVSGLAILAISAVALSGSYTVAGTVVSVVLFLSVFQSTFLVSCFRAIRVESHKSKKIGRHPLV